MGFSLWLTRPVSPYPMLDMLKAVPEESGPSITSRQGTGRELAGAGTHKHGPKIPTLFVHLFVFLESSISLEFAFIFNSQSAAVCSCLPVLSASSTSQTPRSPLYLMAARCVCPHRQAVDAQHEGGLQPTAQAGNEAGAHAQARGPGECGEWHRYALRQA